jgi:hypothetical protein
LLRLHGKSQKLKAAKSSVRALITSLQTFKAGHSISSLIDRAHTAAATVESETSNDGNKMFDQVRQLVDENAHLSEENAELSAEMSNMNNQLYQETFSYNEAENDVNTLDTELSDSMFHGMSSEEVYDSVTNFVYQFQQDADELMFGGQIVPDPGEDASAVNNVTGDTSYTWQLGDPSPPEGTFTHNPLTGPELFEQVMPEMGYNLGDLNLMQLYGGNLLAESLETAAPPSELAKANFNQLAATDTQEFMGPGWASQQAPNTFGGLIVDAENTGGTNLVSSLIDSETLPGDTALDFPTGVEDVASEAGKLVKAFIPFLDM